jgi:hypothetical protein
MSSEVGLYFPEKISPCDISSDPLFKENKNLKFHTPSQLPSHPIKWQHLFPQLCQVQYKTIYKNPSSSYLYRKRCLYLIDINFNYYDINIRNLPVLTQEEHTHIYLSKDVKFLSQIFVVTHLPHLVTFEIGDDGEWLALYYALSPNLSSSNRHHHIPGRFLQNDYLPQYLYFNDLLRDQGKEFLPHSPSSFPSISFVDLISSPSSFISSYYLEIGQQPIFASIVNDEETVEEQILLYSPSPIITHYVNVPVLSTLHITRLIPSTAKKRDKKIRLQHRGLSSSYSPESGKPCQFDLVCPKDSKKSKSPSLHLTFREKRFLRLKISHVKISNPISSKAPHNERSTSSLRKANEHIGMGYLPPDCIPSYLRKDTNEDGGGIQSETWHPP